MKRLHPALWTSGVVLSACLATPRTALAQAEDVTNILWQFPGVPYSEIEPMLQNLQSNNTLKFVSQTAGERRYWSGTVNFASNVTLMCLSDDGVDIKVDGVLKVDRKNEAQSLESDAAKQQIGVVKAGPHLIQVEYVNKIHLGPDDLDGIALIAYYAPADSGSGRVTISSDIQESYSKDPASTDGKARVLAMRASDGSMTVDSVMAQGVMKAGEWIGIATATASQNKYSTGRYVWVTGTNPPDDLEIQRNNEVDVVYGFGSNPAANGATQRDLSVTVTDANNPNSAPLSNTYKIRWHLPVENMKLLPLPTGVPVTFDQLFSAGTVTPTIGSGDFDQKTIQFGPYYLRYLTNYARIVAGFGSDALNFVDKNKLGKGALIAASHFGSGINLGIVEAKVSKNDDRMFDKATELTNEGIRVKTPTGNVPLVPPGKTFGQCILVEPMYWARYKNQIKQHDEYGTNGFEETKITKSEAKDEAEWTGRYEIPAAGTF